MPRLSETSIKDRLAKYQAAVSKQGSSSSLLVGPPSSCTWLALSHHSLLGLRWWSVPIMETGLSRTWSFLLLQEMESSNCLWGGRDFCAGLVCCSFWNGFQTSFSFLPAFETLLPFQSACVSHSSVVISVSHSFALLRMRGEMEVQKVGVTCPKFCCPLLRFHDLVLFIFRLLFLPAISIWTLLAHTSLWGLSWIC